MIKSGAFFISAIMLVTCSSVLGQSRFQLEFKPGINFSSLSGTDPEIKESYPSIGSIPVNDDFFSYNYDPDFFNDAAIRFSGSVLVSYRVTDKVRIQLGVGYNGRGMDLYDRGVVQTSQGTSSKTVLYGSFEYGRKIKTNYITVPINLKYYVGSNQRFFVMGGTYVDFLVSSTVSGYQQYRTQMNLITNGLGQTLLVNRGESQFKDDDAHTSKFDVGLSYGCGVDLRVNERMNFVLALNMNHGLIQIDGEYDNDTEFMIGTSESIVRHANYYGLNSNAKNFTLGASIGLTYQF